jgi:hypothetical protein
MNASPLLLLPMLPPTKQLNHSCTAFANIKSLTRLHLSGGGVSVKMDF